MKKEPKPFNPDLFSIFVLYFWDGEGSLLKIWDRINADIRCAHVAYKAGIETQPSAAPEIDKKGYLDAVQALMPQITRINFRPRKRVPFFIPSDTDDQPYFFNEELSPLYCKWGEGEPWTPSEHGLNVWRQHHPKSRNRPMDFDPSLFWWEHAMKMTRPAGEDFLGLLLYHAICAFFMGRADIGGKILTLMRFVAKAPGSGVRTKPNLWQAYVQG